jgi:hypothetical protein
MSMVLRSDPGGNGARSTSHIANHYGPSSDDHGHRFS